MNNTNVKKVIEKTIEDSEGKKSKQVEITFETMQKENAVKKTITMTGDGSIKVLMPV